MAYFNADGSPLLRGLELTWTELTFDEFSCRDEWSAATVKVRLRTVVGTQPSRGPKTGLGKYSFSQRGRKLLVRFLSVTGSCRRATLKECLWSAGLQGHAVIHCG